MPTIAIPEQGQLVEARQRRYVVADMRQSTLPTDPLSAAPSAPHHLVPLLQRLVLPRPLALPHRHA